MPELTTDKYWSCQCKKANSRPVSFSYCPVCGADQDESELAFIADVEAQLREALQELTGISA